ncbi:MAG: hypothetical protein SAJ12_03720 [Jaaginema sp. PMC 1079.18]|nr:hypothetical protein [Jaaginema sp. PMC 1080.18]MEC4850097.1 hypothetical protein [Jaaginema sp. PMC 1079.18]MEC4864815.1 hypothetical protein [Jaaginema sp. PMC 1078.18]
MSNTFLSIQDGVLKWIQYPNEPYSQFHTILTQGTGWGLVISGYGILWRSGETTTGTLELGYGRLGTSLLLLLAGGLSGSQGNLKSLEIVRRSDNTVLYTETSTNLINAFTNEPRLAVIDTSLLTGEEVSIRFIDNDPASGWAWLGVSPVIYIK